MDHKSLYLLHITFSKNTIVDKKNIYYSILGAFLSLFKDQNSIYQAIVKISFSLDKDILHIYITIQGERDYLTILDSIIRRVKEQISIHGQIFTLQYVDYNVKQFDYKAISATPMQFTVHFLSPTFVRTQNITHVFPTPERFLFSVWKRYQKYFDPIPNTEFDGLLKKRLQYNIIVTQCDIYTKSVFIKKSYKTGVVGSCKYNIKPIDESQDTQLYLKAMSIIVYSMQYLGMGSGVNLGLGNVKVKW